MLLLVATAPIASCKVDRDEVLGAERNREVPYPERLYTPRSQTPEQAARERAPRAPDAADLDGGVPDGGEPPR